MYGYIAAHQPFNDCRLRQSCREMRSWTDVFILMLTLNLSAPSEARVPLSQPAQHFHCPDAIVISFVDLGQEAVFSTSNQELRLRKKPFAFGRRFTDDRWTIIVDGKKMVIASTAAPGLFQCEMR